MHVAPSTEVVSAAHRNEVKLLQREQNLMHSIALLQKELHLVRSDLQTIETARKRVQQSNTQSIIPQSEKYLQCHQ